MMSDELSPVALAPLERASESVLQQQTELFAQQEVLAATLNAMVLPVLVVNSHRQIIFANQAMADLVDAENGAALVGIRPGEALHCHYVDAGEAGCGTSPFCRYCGAARAMAEVELGAEREEEAFILRDFGQFPAALDLHIVAKSFQLGQERFTMMTIRDISGEKRRVAMERIFFHDVLNTVQKMRIAADMLDEEDASDDEMLRKVIQKSVTRLTEEILAQRDLSEMENGELAIRASEIRSREILTDMVDSYLEGGLVRGHRVQLADDTADVHFLVDETQLRRVLDNMLKNALEAEDTEAKITLGCRFLPSDPLQGRPRDMVEFWVHNPRVMSEAVQWQIFRRSFTTKGKGRGLGTYSMKVLTERYLEGEIDFTSEPGQGTTFQARYPVSPSYA